MFLEGVAIRLTMTALPAGVVIEAIVPSGVSAWCETVRIDARLGDGTLRRYFKKVCRNPERDRCYGVLVDLTWQRRNRARLAAA
jgi:hypothetical protein